MTKFPSYRFHPTGAMCLCYTPGDADSLPGWSETPPEEYGQLYNSVHEVPSDLITETFYSLTDDEDSAEEEEESEEEEIIPMAKPKKVAPVKKIRGGGVRL